MYIYILSMQRKCFTASSVEFVIDFALLAHTSARQAHGQIPTDMSIKLSTQAQITDVDLTNIQRHARVGGLQMGLVERVLQKLCKWENDS